MSTYNILFGYHSVVVQPSVGDFYDATGGIISYDGDFKIHTFFNGGTFSITRQPSLNRFVKPINFLVVGGGGSGGGVGGGGGAGGVVSGQFGISTSVGSFVGNYTVTTGFGGAGVTGQSNGNNGGNSLVSDLSGLGRISGAFANGGGGGGGGTNSGLSGGSGGGGGRISGAGGGGIGGQGNNGGAGGGGSLGGAGGGGGGAGSSGQNGSSAGDSIGGNGGSGSFSSITGTSIAYGGGGGGGGLGGAGNGGTGGGGSASTAAGVTSQQGTNGLGGGGGATSVSSSTSGAGGSGVVIFRYQYKGTPPDPNPVKVRLFNWNFRTSGDFYSGFGVGVFTPNFPISNYFVMSIGDSFYIDSVQEGSWTQGGSQSRRYYLVYGTPAYFEFYGYGDGGRKRNFYTANYDGFNNFYVYGEYRGSSTSFPQCNIAIVKAAFLGPGAAGIDSFFLNVDNGAYRAIYWNSSI